MDKTIFQGDTIEAIERQLEGKSVTESELRRDLVKYRTLQKRLREKLNFYHKEQVQLRKELVFYQQEHKNWLQSLHQEQKQKELQQELQAQFSFICDDECPQESAAKAIEETAQSIQAELPSPIQKEIASKSKACKGTNATSYDWTELHNEKVNMHLTDIPGDLGKSEVNNAFAHNISSNSSCSIPRLSDSECSAFGLENRQNSLVYSKGEEIEILFSADTEITQHSQPDEMREHNQRNKMGVASMPRPQKATDVQQELGDFNAAGMAAMSFEKNGLQADLRAHWKSLITVKDRLADTFNGEILSTTQIGDMKAQDDVSSQYTEVNPELAGSKSISKKDCLSASEVIFYVHQKMRNASLGLEALLGQEEQLCHREEARFASTSLGNQNESEQAQPAGESSTDFSKALVSLCHENCATTGNCIQNIRESIFRSPLIHKQLFTFYGASLVSVEDGDNKQDTADLKTTVQTFSEEPDKAQRDVILVEGCRTRIGNDFMVDDAENKDAKVETMKQSNSRSLDSRVSKMKLYGEASKAIYIDGEVKAVEMVYDDSERTSNEDFPSDDGCPADGAVTANAETQSSQKYNNKAICLAPKIIQIDEFLRLLLNETVLSNWGSVSGWVIPTQYGRGNQ